LEPDTAVKFWEMFSAFSIEEVLIWEDRMAKQLPKLEWSLKNVFSQLSKLAPDFSQIFESVFRILLEEFNNNINHVI
jgi:hypothetical protein